MNALNEMVKSGSQRAEFILRFNIQTARQVALTLGNILHGAGHNVQWLHQQADKKAEQCNDRYHSNQRGNDCGSAEITQCSEGFIFVDRQADVPIGIAQPFDWRKGHNSGFAIEFDFADICADCRCFLGVNIFQVFCRQFFVWVYQYLAISVDKEGIAHAIEIQ